MRARLLAMLPYLPGVLLLASHPAAWLVRSWTSEAHGSDGGWVFALAVAIAAWSASSPRREEAAARSARTGVALLALTYTVRLAGEVLAVSTIGAIALVVDVYAAALLLGLRERERSVSPLGLALLFALCLPVEHVLQRCLGYPFQITSAKGVCGLLGLLHHGLTCEGTLISLSGAALSVDLPCSGAQGLVHLAVLVSALAALRRLAGRRLAAGILVACFGALAANALRIFLLAEAMLAGVDVAAEPVHSLIGLVGLALVAAAVLACASSRRPPAIAPRAEVLACASKRPPVFAPHARVPATRVGRPAIASYALGALLLAVAVVVVHAPARPIDVLRDVPPVLLPSAANGAPAKDIALTPGEAAYFTQYGGQARKRSYGAQAVLAVRTRAPLRHLHSPDQCLTGAGHRVRLLGVRRDPVFTHTAVYRSEDASGAVWRIEVSYFDARGARASSASEVAWRWLSGPPATWTMVQRISPFGLCASDPRACAELDLDLARALDLTPEKETQG